ncbi:MAG: MBL fold metallo-hydrolase [Lacrimispora sp.]|uniref:MBL fold metallo-hydrolase n=1 Tax=Lacrimispora sp. TaxID=2719234 RepID=UPI0039E5DA1B
MSDFRIKTYPVGQIGTNCYVLYRQGTEGAVIVDPGDNGAYILNMCRELSLTPEAILLTHGHFDHILAVEDIRRAFPGIKVYGGEAEKDLFTNPALNLSAAFGSVCMVSDVEYVGDGDLLSLAGISFEVLSTPGHTPGSVCYLVREEDVLISGDTLFQESLGRTDLPTGNQNQIIKSIREKLFTLREDILVYPGHGDKTTVGHEKVYNPVASYNRG